MLSSCSSKSEVFYLASSHRLSDKFVYESAVVVCSKLKPLTKVALGVSDVPRALSSKFLKNSTSGLYAIIFFYRTSVAFASLTPGDWIEDLSYNLSCTHYYQILAIHKIISL